ncbi:MAG TPA: hypothetical protein DEA08_01990 [Planctomycetes bacterium]|nr:hypothetical protein [Planctomycetota bacterium]
MSASWIKTQPLSGLDGGLAVRPEGHIRARTSAEFREYVDELLDADEAIRWLVVDFDDVLSIDSSTAGYLLNLHDTMNSRSGALALASLTPTVRVVIDSIGLMTFFMVAESIEEAVEEFRYR